MAVAADWQRKRALERKKKIEVVLVSEIKVVGNCEAAVGAIGVTDHALVARRRH